MAAHRYWRIKFVGTGAGSSIAIREIKFLATAGGDALAGTPIASDAYGGLTSSFAPSKSFDGITNDLDYNFWMSVTSSPWIGLDLGSPKSIAQYVIYNNAVGEITSGFSLDSSDDGVTWAVEESHTNVPWVSYTSQTFTLPVPVALPGQHNYWRLTGFLTDSNELELSQAQLYDGVQLIAQAPTFTVAPTTGSAFPDVLHWDDFSMPGFALVWNLATPVANPNLRLGAGSSALNFPKEFYCQYSDDGLFWSTNNAPTNVAFPGAGALTAAPGTIVAETGDLDFSKVSLLVHGDGDAGSTGIVDSSSNKKVVTVSGPTISTASPKFGTGAINFPGSGSVAFADSPDFDLPGDFTIELFAWAATAAGTGVLFSKKSNDNGGGWTRVYKNTNNTDVYLVIDTAAGGSVSFIAPSALTVGAWVHLAVTRSGNSVMLFVAGVKVFTGALTSPPSTNSDPLRLGQAGPGGNYPFVGKIDEFRITKGVARYTADFTPSVTAFPDSAAAAVTQFIPLSTTPAPQRWRTTSLFAEPIVGAEMPAFNLREVTMETSFMDAYHGGRGIIRATVKQKNTPVNTPLRRRVDLLDESSRLVIRSTWSDPVTGIYAFAGIREDLVYTVVSYDLLHDKRAVIADNLTLANGGVELMP